MSVFKSPSASTGNVFDGSQPDGSPVSERDSCGVVPSVEKVALARPLSPWRVSTSVPETTTEVSVSETRFASVSWISSLPSCAVRSAVMGGELRAAPPIENGLDSSAVAMSRWRAGPSTGTGHPATPGRGRSRCSRRSTSR